MLRTLVLIMTAHFVLWTLAAGLIVLALVYALASKVGLAGIGGLGYARSNAARPGHLAGGRGSRLLEVQLRRHYPLLPRTSTPTPGPRISKAN